MREILFRAKTVCDGDWIYGGITWNPSKKKVFIHTKWDEGKAIPETVGQYTGLTDKNGTKIFEGDILKWKRQHSISNPFLYKVKWCDECAMFILPCITNENFDTDFTVIELEEVEVVGNVHDNPELLQQVGD